MPETAQATSCNAHWRWAFILIYVGLSIAGVCCLQLSRATEIINVDLDNVFKGGVWYFPGTNVVLRRQYLGIGPLDFAASFLVAVFTHGAAGWTKGIKLQQGYFLLQFLPVIAVWAIESARKRNSWALISL
jgi:hypothetical protein